MSESPDAIDRAAEANARFHPVHIEAEVVTRPVGPATATIHGFLRHLRSQGLTCVPEPWGVADGLEKLRYIEGDSGGQGWYHQHTDQGLKSAARLLRQVHDASRDWAPPPGSTWGASPVDADEVVYCHGDPGPWNFVWQDEQAIGLIDWDYLHPAPRLDDVAYALHWFVPLRADEHVLDWHHFPSVPDRRERARTFLAAYGNLPDFDVASTVMRRIRATSDHELRLANEGVEPQRSWVADGSQERAAVEIAWIEEHRADINL
jgi:aminoglycoside phosphotransferase (APT) family kinase protein